jgi:PAS domain S-box-containing protein
MLPALWRNIGSGWAAVTGLRRTRRSVRGKLMRMVSLTTASALLVAAAAMLAHDLEVYRRSWTADLTTQASILALSTAPALDFDDRPAAERNLIALQAQPQVLAAALYRTDGSLYADYAREGIVLPAHLLPGQQPAVRITGNKIELVRSVDRNREWLGTIYLCAQYDVAGRLGAYLGILALVMAVSLLAALILSTRLQRSITAPLDAMTAVARQVVDQRDYSLRARKSSDDEIGLVVDAFNGMLDEVQLRARALEQSNSALRTEVRVRQAAEAALERATARLESTMAAAEIGSWIWDLQTDEVTADRNLAALYGVGHERELRGDPALRRRTIHPEDRALVEAAESSALRTGALASTEFRIVQPDGSWRWVVSRGKVHFDAKGQPVLLAGLLIDMTAQKAVEQAWRQSEKLYRAIGESIDFGVWLADAGGRNTYASESFLRLLGMTQQQSSQRGWWHLLHPEDLAATRDAWQECQRNGSGWYCEYRCLGVDGEYHPILAQGVPIRDDTGRVTGWAGINLDISRVKRTEQALREADRRKDEFLATLAHELRNPLAPIRNAARLLETAGVDDRQRQWGRDVIARQVQRMALLLDDLLDVSRITRGQLQLRKARVELSSVVAAAVETARPMVDAKRHSLDVRLPAQPVELEVDPLRLSQALSNLLTNAAKYTDPGGAITLAASVEGTELQLRVQDSGIGLSPQSIPRLFEMFSQVDAAADRAEGGLGIGLALVRGLVALHGGTVAASSEGPGLGSQFVIRLPQAAVGAAQAHAESPRTPAREVSGNRCTVLVADDNVDAADTLALLLRMNGYDVLLAHSGSQALDLAQQQRPRAMVLDIGMPGLSGYEVCRAIRESAWGREPLLLAVTGWGQPNDRDRAQAAGFDHHLTKPVDPEQVEQLLQAFLQRHPDSKLGGRAR